MRDTIHIIEEMVLKFPEKIAVIDGDMNISYRFFNQTINAYSAFLESFCTAPIVAFDLNQGFEAYSLMIAVLKIGGTFCPLNPESPTERKKYIIDELKADIYIADTKVKLDKIETTNKVLISEIDINTRYNIENRDYTGHQAYVIYTSGSTGNPKGVKIQRDALNKFLEWSIPTYAANENDIWGQYCYLTFDLSIVDIFTCLCSGATLVVLGDKISKILPSTMIEKHKITIWHSIPSAIELMQKREESKTADFSTLRLMSFCGEPLKKHHVEF